jgi:hypothetical protein
MVLACFPAHRTYPLLVSAEFLLGSKYERVTRPLLPFFCIVCLLGSKYDGCVL